MTTYFSAVTWFNESWTPSSGWTGSAVPALYRGFDGSHGLIMMEGNKQVHSVRLVTGKVSYFQGKILLEVLTLEFCKEFTLCYSLQER